MELFSYSRVFIATQKTVEVLVGVLLEIDNFIHGTHVRCLPPTLGEPTRTFPCTALKTKSIHPPELSTAQDTICYRERTT